MRKIQGCTYVGIMPSNKSDIKNEKLCFVHVSCCFLCIYLNYVGDSYLKNITCSRLSSHLSGWLHLTR